MRYLHTHEPPCLTIIRHHGAFLACKHKRWMLCTPSSVPRPRAPPDMSIARNKSFKLALTRWYQCKKRHFGQHHDSVHDNPTLALRARPEFLTLLKKQYPALFSIIIYRYHDKALAEDLRAAAVLWRYSGSQPFLRVSSLGRFSGYSLFHYLKGRPR